MPNDKIQREIEELLNRLDEFVPDKNPSQSRRPSSTTSAGAKHSFTAGLSHISLKHVMLAALGLVLVAFVAMPVNPLVGRYVAIAGLLLFGTSFALSFFSRSAPPAPEKRWRGQVMDLQSPSLGDRLRAWFEGKRRRSQ